MKKIILALVLVLTASILLPQNVVASSQPLIFGLYRDGYDDYWIDQVPAVNWTRHQPWEAVLTVLSGGEDYSQVNLTCPKGFPGVGYYVSYLPEPDQYGNVGLIQNGSAIYLYEYNYTIILDINRMRWPNGGFELVIGPYTPNDFNASLPQDIYWKEIPPVVIPEFPTTFSMTMVLTVLTLALFLTRKRMETTAGRDNY